MGEINEGGFFRPRYFFAQRQPVALKRLPLIQRIDLILEMGMLL